MAHYSKKRPAFRSRTEIYKKSKWVKFKETMALFFSNVKRAFMKLALKINEKGSQKLTVMIVPHSEKKIFNLQISNYVMFFTLLTLLILSLTSVFTISDNQYRKKKSVRLEEENANQIVMIEEYKRSINSLNDRYANFKSDLETILKGNNKTENKYDFKDIKIVGNDTNKLIPNEVKDLEKLESELEITKDKIKSLYNFIEQKKRLLKEIPSRYPLSVSWARITSPYGWRIDPVYRWQKKFHEGLDLATFPGTPVLASADGVVEYAHYSGGYGNVVLLKHKYGFETKYAHMMRFGPQIETGVTVHQGQIIGYVGTTGKSTGYHLHYEVRIGGKTVNPISYVRMLP